MLKIYNWQLSIETTKKYLTLRVVFLFCENFFMLWKLELAFANWFITPLESDTLWAYLMYYLDYLWESNLFEKLKDWLEKWNICFSSAFPIKSWKVYFPKPLIQTENQSDEWVFNLEKTIKNSFKDYVWKKKIRKAEYISQQAIKKFIQKEFDKISDEDIFNLSNYLWVKVQNSIPRWDYVENEEEETNVYSVEDIIWWPGWAFFVKSKNEKIDDILNKMKEIFLIFGWWKAKSRGLGVVKKFEIKQDLDENILKIFEENNVALSNVYVNDLNKAENIKVDIKLPTRIPKDEKFLDKVIVYVKHGSVVSDEGKVLKFDEDGKITEDSENYKKLLSGKNFSKC